MKLNQIIRIKEREEKESKANRKRSIINTLRNAYTHSTTQDANNMQKRWTPIKPRN